MAGDYLPVRLDLRDDPAVIAMAAELSLEQDLIVGKLVRLWSWANRHTANGYVRGIAAQWVDAYVGCAGFASAMARVRWLAVSDDGATFPRWDRWNGKSAKTRLEDAQRQREHRVKKSGVTKMSRPARDKNVTTVQERREEDRREGDHEERALKDRASDDFFEITSEHLADARKVALAVKPRKRADYLLVARAVLLKREIGENTLWDAVEAVKHTTNTVPAAYFLSMLRNNSARFDELASSIDLGDADLVRLFVDAPTPYLPERRPTQTAPLLGE